MFVPGFKHGVIGLHAFGFLDQNILQDRHIQLGQFVAAQTITAPVSNGILGRHGEGIGGTGEQRHATGTGGSVEPAVDGIRDEGRTENIRPLTAGAGRPAQEVLARAERQTVIGA